MKLSLSVILLLIGFFASAQENKETTTQQSREVNSKIKKPSVKKVVDVSKKTTIDTISNTVRTKQFQPNFSTTPKAELDAGSKKKDSVMQNHNKLESRSKVSVKRVSSSEKPKVAKSISE